jgi:hypothetical protein
MFVDLSLFLDPPSTPPNLPRIQTIKRFKAGEFNTLVATSIGEEGLDIGEVDLIICYEAQKSPVRMVCIPIPFPCAGNLKI